MKLTTEEIAKVFAMYQGQYAHISGYGTFKFVGGTNEKFWVYGKPQNHYYYNDKDYTAKLLLTPLDKISDEHAIEVAKITGSRFLTDHDLKICGESIVKGRTWEFVDENIWGYFPIIQQLILWGYAVPLFFGLNHWANGKTAIQLEIAIDKTTLK